MIFDLLKKLFSTSSGADVRLLNLDKIPYYQDRYGNNYSFEKIKGVVCLEGITLDEFYERTGLNNENCVEKIKGLRALGVHKFGEKPFTKPVSDEEYLKRLESNYKIKAGF